MVFCKLGSLLMCACNFDATMGMDVLAPFATQPAWQAGEPIAVNVDYDVPAFGPQDAATNVPTPSNIDNGLAAERIHSHTLSTEGTAKVSTPERHASSSFLATQVLPVDADRIKKSLYLTQALRSPPQASVNVIMQEDVQHMKDASKYNGMVEQTRALQNEFRKGLAALSGGVA
jgi:hypothetical protein